MYFYINFLTENFYKSALNSSRNVITETEEVEVRKRYVWVFSSSSLNRQHLWYIYGYICVILFDHKRTSCQVKGKLIRPCIHYSASPSNTSLLLPLLLLNLFYTRPLFLPILGLTLARSPATTHHHPAVSSNGNDKKRRCRKTKSTAWAQRYHICHQAQELMTTVMMGKLGWRPLDLTNSLLFWAWCDVGDKCH